MKKVEERDQRDRSRQSALEVFDPARHSPGDVKGLLAMAEGYQTPERLDEVLGEYATKKDYALFVASVSSRITGLIGINTGKQPFGTITHLAVHSGFRRQGTGRWMIREAVRRTGLDTVAVETDDDAVGFYRRCGFAMTEIESRWPGVRRYQGRLSIHA